ncbi:MAG: hypothetical protein WD737_11890 [Gemmatimonadota bacterium]
MEPKGGDTEMEGGGGRIDSHMYMRSDRSGTQAGGRGGFERSFEGTGGLRDRAAHLADQARNAVGSTVGRAGDLMGRRPDLLDTVRSNPLTALGLAFSAGLVIAVSTEGRRRNWMVERGRLRMRSVLIGALSATIAHELRALIGAEEGIGGLVESFLDGEGESVEYDDALDREYDDELA